MLFGKKNVSEEELNVPKEKERSGESAFFTDQLITPIIFDGEKVTYQSDILHDYNINLANYFNCKNANLLLKCDQNLFVKNSNLKQSLYGLDRMNMNVFIDSYVIYTIQSSIQNMIIWFKNNCKLYAPDADITTKSLIENILFAFQRDINFFSYESNTVTDDIRISFRNLIINSNSMIVEANNCAAEDKNNILTYSAYFARICTDQILSILSLYFNTSADKTINEYWVFLNSGNRRARLKSKEIDTTNDLNQYLEIKNIVCETINSCLKIVISKAISNIGISIIAATNDLYNSNPCYVNNYVKGINKVLDERAIKKIAAKKALREYVPEDDDMFEP